MTELQLVLSAVLVAAAFLIMARVCGVHRIGQPTMLGVGFLCFFAMHYVPSLFFLADPAMTHAWPLFWACTLSLFMMALGGAYANSVTFFERGEIRRYLDVAANTPPTRRDLLLVLAWGGLCLLLFTTYVREVRVYPLYALLAGSVSSEAVNKMRRDVVGPEMGSSLWYVYGLARAFIMPFLFCLVFVTFRYVRSVPIRVLCVGFVLMVFIFNSWSAAKTPIAMLFVLGFVLSLMLGSRALIVMRRHAGRLRPKRWRRWIAVGGCVGLAAAYPIFIFKFKAFGVDKEVFDILVQGVLTRILFKPAYLAHYAFALFPAQFDFTYFADIQKLAAVFGLEYFDLSTLIAEEQGHPDSNASPPAVGTFYAELGWPLVIGGFFVVGVVVQFLQIWLIRNVPRGPIVLAANAMLCYGAFRLSMTSLHTVLLTEAIIPCLMALMGWRLVRRMTVVLSARPARPRPSAARLAPEP